MAARDGGAGSSRSDNSWIRNEVVNMYKSFVSEVNPRDVLDLLIEKRVISIERKDEIMSKTTKQDRCRALLDQLFSSSHDGAFVVLRQALEENYHWIVERIDKSKSAEDKSISSGNHDNVLDMVRRLEHSEKWTEVESRQVLIKQNRLAIKEDQDLEATKKDLQLTKKHELELIQQLDEANRKIKELEEVVEHRTKAQQLDSQLIGLHDSHDEAMGSEQKLRDQLAILEAWVKLIENRDYVNYPWKPTVKDEIKNEEGPGNFLVPHLPPRRSTCSTELSEHANETAELQTTCSLLKDREVKCSDLHLESCVKSFPQTEFWKGKWKKSTDVLVKKLINSKRSPSEFFLEAQILRKLDHPNVVRLIGISSLAQPLHIVIEYLSKGNLHDFLKEDKGSTIDLLLIIDFAKQIAEGMCYVARQSIVHRDLRAGTLLLASSNLIKISNFELALDLQNRSKAQERSEELKIPIRWTAPESLQFWLWTSASDVWSYGILLYEMFTFGKIPYSGKTNEEVFDLMQDDYHLPFPKGEKVLRCPASVYRTMVWCWDKEADARPSFKMLQGFFQEFFQDSEGDNIQDTIFSRPRFVTIIKGSTVVRGMALLDGWLYVVRSGSTQVEVFEARGGFKRSKKSIMLPGQKDKSGLFQRLKLRLKEKHISSGIQDIASCNRNKRLYLSDWQNICVHCVDPIKKEVIRSWSVESGEPWGIFVNGEGNIIVSCSDSAQLCEYSAEGIFLRSIELLNADEGPWHGLKLWGADRWVVCHGGRYNNKSHVCVVDSAGNYAKGYEEIHLNGASHLALLSSNHVLVAESTRNRIILLSPSLRGPPQEILNQEFGIITPVRLHLCELSGRLVVGLVDGTVVIYQIMNAADGQMNSADYY